MHGSQVDLDDVAAAKNATEGVFYKIFGKKYFFNLLILDPKRCLVRTCCEFSAHENLDDICGR